MTIGKLFSLIFFGCCFLTALIIYLMIYFTDINVAYFTEPRISIFVNICFLVIINLAASSLIFALIVLLRLNKKAP